MSFHTPSVILYVFFMKLGLSPQSRFHSNPRGAQTKKKEKEILLTSSYAQSDKHISEAVSVKRFAKSLRLCLDWLVET